MALKRITAEYRNLQSDPLENCCAGPANHDNLRTWTGSVAGPPNTPYTNGTFRISIQYPENYPHSPPQVVFITPIFHPNVSLQGEIRLAELEQAQWSPAFTVRTILISLQAMLSDPDLLESCISNEEAAKLYSDDYEVFRETAYQWTMSHAFQ